MRLVHEPASDDGADGDDRRQLASHVEVADTLRSQFVGLRFRDELPDDHALVIEVPESSLPFTGDPSRATVDMIGVGFPIDVCWLADDRVVHTKRLRPWVGVGIARADRIVELPAGRADDVTTGDRIRVRED